MIKNTNCIDIIFNNLVAYIKERSLKEIIDAIKHNFNYYHDTNPMQYRNIANYYNKYKLWGSIDLNKHDYELINRNAHALFDHIDDFIWFYNILDDYRSKKVLTNVLLYWLMLDDKKIAELQDSFYSQYFDLDIIKCDDKEVFVDVGAYTGDTIVNYIRAYGDKCYKKMYCYEIVPANIKYINDNIKLFKMDNVIIRDKGASNKKDKLFIDNDDVSSITKLSSSGQIEIEAVKVDDDINGEVTFIKMDIEGGELLALEGLKKKITKYKPKLAISVYHCNNHLWQIPKFIYELNPNYKFYLRYYGGPILPTEYILYAV